MDRSLGKPWRVRLPVGKMFRQLSAVTAEDLCIKPQRALRHEQSRDDPRRPSFTRRNRFDHV